TPKRRTDASAYHCFEPEISQRPAITGTRAPFDIGQISGWGQGEMRVKEGPSLSRRRNLLISLDSAMLAHAGLRTTDLSFNVGDTVFERGAPAQFIYVVNAGALLRFRPLPGGRRSILQFLFAGDGFGYEPGG